jgi:methanogenic corrinoid protein MtbC1
MMSSPLDEVDIEAFAAALLGDDEEAPMDWLERLLERGFTAESLFMDLFAPTARHFGELWVEDCADPAMVTFGVGRLHRLMRRLGPGFESEADVGSNGRRILLATPAGEQHVFGLAMLAEFFRRDGWEVLGGPGGSEDDLAAQLQDEWIDVLGLSVGSESRLPWLRNRIAQLRGVSRNRGLVVMVGGPIFTLNPHWVYEVGADATADAAQAPRLAEKMLGKGRLTRARRRAPPGDSQSATS